MGSSPGSGNRSSFFRQREGDVGSESLPELQSVIAIVNLKAHRSYFLFAYCFTTDSSCRWEKECSIRFLLAFPPPWHQANSFLGIWRLMYEEGGDMLMWILGSPFVGFFF